MQDAAALEAHVVDDEPLLGIERCRQLPVEPADAIAVDGERHAVGLDDVDRLEALAQRHGAQRVVAVGLWNRLHVVLLHREHALLIEVEDREQALDRAGVAVLAHRPPEVRHAARDAMVLLQLVPHLGGGEHVDLHGLHVGDAALGERFEHQRILLDCGLRGDVLVRGDRRLRAGEVAIFCDRPAVEVNGDLAHLALRVVDRGPTTAGGQRTAGVAPGEVRVLGGLPRADRDEDGIGRTVSCAREFRGAAHLVGREGMQRMERHA